MPKYTDDFRYRARLALQTAGYPTKLNALRDVSRLLGIPRHTLKRWFYQPVPPAPPTRLMLQPMLMHEVQRTLDQLDHQRDKASYTQLSRTLTQLVDTLHQLDSRD